MAEQNIYTNITATANFTSLTAQLRAVTAELIKLQATTIGLDRNLSNEVGRMNRAFADTMRATGQFSSHFVTLESDVQKFGKRLDTGRMKLGEYYGVWQGHARKTSTLLRDLAKQQVLMENAVMQPLGRNAQGQMQYNVHVANGLDVLKNRTAILRQEASILNKVMLDGSNQLINWGKNTQWAGRQLTVGLTVPMMAFGAAAQKAFLEADQQLVRLTKVYGGLSATSSTELKQIRNDVEQTAKELASIYGASYKETIGLAADIAATGKQGNDLLVATQETTRLAILGEVDRQDAMKATLAIQNAFKQSNDELAESINFLNAVENQTSTSLADLIEAIPKAGPVIQSLGGDIQDLALYLTAMKEGGVNASEGANAIKSSLASLINPTKVAKEMFMGFGIDLGSIVKNNAGDITATILALQESLDKLDPLQKAQAIEQLFGKFQFARMGALFNNLGKEGSQTLQVLDLMKASTEELGSIADRELKAMTESASGQYKRALETIKAELAGVGDQFLKISTFVLKTISGIIKFTENLPGPIKSLLTFLGGLTAFAGPLIMLTGVLGNFLGYIIKGVFHLKQLFRGGAGFKLLTPEMMAAAEAGKIVEKSFFSDAQAAIALETAVNNLAASFDRLKTSALNSAVATSSSMSTMGGSAVLSPAGTAANADRMADKNSPYIGSPYSRQFAHTIPSATEQPGTIFGVVPNPGPVNVRVGKNPQMYMDQDLPRIPGVTSISGVSTGIVAGEAAKWHAMTAAIATQSQAELSLLKTEVAATGTVTHELSSVYQAMLPQMQQLTALAADEGRMIVQQLQQGVITVDQARAKIISLNATIEIMMAETAAQVAAGMGRGINLTTVPFTSQPVVDPVTGKSNMKEMFHKPETAALVDDVARGLGVRTSGGGYSIETTKPRIILPKRGPIRGFNDGGYVYTLEDGPVVPGDKSINYDNTMAKIPEGGFVLNQEATRNNPQLVDYAKRSKPYNRGGMIDAMLTPYETVFTPEQTQEMLPILEAANSGQRIQFRNAGGILGGPIVDGKHNYGRFDLLKSLFRRKPGASVDELANLSPQMKLGRKTTTSKDDAHDYVRDALGDAAPVGRTLGNKNGYFFVGNWGLNTRKTTNSKINTGTATSQEIIDDILSLPASDALPALRRFLKVNKVNDELSETLVLEARDGIVANLSAHGDLLIGEKLFAQAQHAEYLKIADQLGLRKKYIDSLNIPGQRRGFRDPGDTKSGFKGATAITPYGATNVDDLIAKNDEFGTSFMGSYETYNDKGLRVNGGEGAFAHMQLDEFAMGGIIGKNKANYGRLFLGMPRSIKQVQEQRKRRQVMEETTEAVKNSRFAKEEPTNFGKLEEETTGHSFPVGGIGGLYTKPDGTKVFVKPVLDEKAALAEQRYNVIHKDAHDLEPPKQEVRVMIDPTDPAGKRKLLVLESPYDPKFAKMPEKMTEDEYFKQLLASALRGDKDLSKGNVGGSLVPDAGTSGVFKTASGLRDYADDMPSVAEQARINLLGVKGGAKRFFAESTIDIPKGLTAEQYHDRMIREIDYVLPRLKDVVSGPKLGLNKDEQPFYDAIIQRLEDARHVNWKEFHGIHSAVKPTAAKAMTPAALAKIEEALALKERQKGHAASLSDMAFKSDANGFNGGGLINLIKSLAMKRIGAGFGKDTKGGWGVTSLEIGMAEKLFGSTGLTKRTQRMLYDKFAEQLAKEMPYGYAKNSQGHLVKALEPSVVDSVMRMSASSTLSSPEGRKVLSAIDREILRKKFANWESKKDTPVTKALQELIFKLEGRAAGGPVSGGTPYIVGEKGPELFVPMNNGGIVPNYALGGMIKTGKANYGMAGTTGKIIAQQALPMAAFMLLPTLLNKMGIASDKTNVILNGIFLAITGGQIFKGVKMAKAAKAAKAVDAAGDVTALAAAEKSAGKFGQALSKLNLAGKAIPGWGKVAILALTTLATVSYGAWENARKARLASQEAFDVNETQAKQLGITYVSLTDKIKKATEAAKAQSQLTKLKAAGSTAIGGGINMSVKELNTLQKKAKETQGDIVQMFNNLDKNDVTKAAAALKVQLVAAGKSAQDAAKEIYSIISVSNKAAQATEAVSSSQFLAIVDRASAAKVAIDTFVKSMQVGDVDKKEIAASFSGGLDAIQLYYQSLVGVKDATGKAKTQTEALNDTIEQMNAYKSNQVDIGGDILNTLVKENPLYKDILNANDNMVDAWAKIQLYTNGVTANLSEISGKEAQDLLHVVTAISQAASEMTTNANLMNNPLDAIADYGTAAKLAYDKAKKASDDATKNAQKNADAEIKAIDKKIEKINEEADARIRAIEDQASKQDYLTEIQKEQINYQQALLAGDMSRAAQSQLNIQGLTNERQKTIAVDSINDKRNAEIKKLEEAKAGVQERLLKLQEKANKLQEIANTKQKEYADIQVLQQSIATTISKASMTTDEGILGTLAKALQSDVAALAKINASGAAAAKTITSDVPVKAGIPVLGPMGAQIKQPGTADWLSYLKKIVNDPGGANNSAVEYGQKYFDGFGTHVDSFGMYVKKLLGLPEVGSAKKFANSSGAPVKLTLDRTTGDYVDEKGKSYNTSERFFMAKPAEDTNASWKSYKHPVKANRGTTIYNDYDGQPRFKDYYDGKTKLTYTADGRVLNAAGVTLGRWANENYADVNNKKVVSYNKGGKVKHFEPGGSVFGPGTGTSDDIPAYLSNGEYVIRAAAVKKYGVDTFDKLNAEKLHKGGPVHRHGRNLPNSKFRWQPYPEDMPNYWSDGKPSGSPYTQRWGDLRYAPAKGKDIWGGTEIPGLRFDGKIANRSDYWHQIAEQPSKSSGPGMGIDKDPMRYAGSGASMGGIGNGAYGLGPLLFASGGMVPGFKKGGSIWSKLWKNTKAAGLLASDLLGTTSVARIAHDYGMGMQRGLVSGFANMANPYKQYSIPAEPFKKMANKTDYTNAAWLGGSLLTGGVLKAAQGALRLRGLYKTAKYAVPPAINAPFVAPLGKQLYDGKKEIDSEYKKYNLETPSIWTILKDAGQGMYTDAYARANGKRNGGLALKNGYAAFSGKGASWIDNAIAAAAKAAAKKAAAKSAAAAAAKNSTPTRMTSDADEWAPTKTLNDFGSDFIIGNQTPIDHDQFASIYNIPFPKIGQRQVAGSASMFHNPLDRVTILESVYGLNGSNKSALFGIPLLEAMMRGNKLVLSDDRSTFAERLAALLEKKNLKNIIGVPPKKPESAIDMTGDPMAWAYGQAHSSREYIERALNPWTPGTPHGYSPLSPHQILAASMATRHVLGDKKIDMKLLQDMLQQYTSGKPKKLANGGIALKNGYAAFSRAGWIDDAVAAAAKAAAKKAEAKAAAAAAAAASRQAKSDARKAALAALKAKLKVAPLKVIPKKIMSPIMAVGRYKEDLRISRDPANEYPPFAYDSPEALRIREANDSFGGRMPGINSHLAGTTLADNTAFVIKSLEKRIAAVKFDFAMKKWTIEHRELLREDISKFWETMQSDPEMLALGRAADLDTNYWHNGFSSNLFIDKPIDELNRELLKELAPLLQTKRSAETYLTSKIFAPERLKDRLLSGGAFKGRLEGFGLLSKVQTATRLSDHLPGGIQGALLTATARHRSGSVLDTDNLDHPRVHDTEGTGGRAYGPPTYFAQTPIQSEKMFNSFGSNVYRMSLSPKEWMKMIFSKGYITPDDFYERLAKFNADAIRSGTPEADTKINIGSMKWDDPFIQQLIASGFHGFKHGDALTNWLVNSKPGYGMERIKWSTPKFEPVNKAQGGYIGNPSFNIPKFESGINMVPADMLAMIHKNEAVVPANMNPFNPNANNATMGGGVYNITNNINGADCDINELSDIVTRKTIDSINNISKINMKSVGQNRSLGSSLEVRA